MPEAVEGHMKWIPTYEELRVPELKLSYPTLKAGSIYLGRYCELPSKEFMLCRSEYRDPRKCLKEGRDVTACGIKFFQQIKKHCRDVFEEYIHCLDYGSKCVSLHTCRSYQHDFDKCVFEKMGLERPILGHYCKPFIHDSERPPPKLHQRDYFKEAREKVPDLPEDWPVSNEYKPYYAGQGTKEWGYFGLID